jgi:hypothetical protein
MGLQVTFDYAVSFPSEAYAYGDRSSGERHGVVLTKPHVVDLILDLAGYAVERDLGALSLLEPACGRGVFLEAAVRRLVESARRKGRDFAALDKAITGYDVDSDHVAESRAAVARILREHGAGAKQANELANAWITRADFLLVPERRAFDVVVGNPPYIRIEQLTTALQVEYRARYESLYDRADLYVAFIERALTLLSQEGVLSFICADRWTLNRYGAPLRRLISERFRVSTYIDLHRASPFESDVIAYPAIFAIGRGKTDAVLVGRLATADAEECRRIGCAIAHPDSPTSTELAVYKSWFRGDDPWVLGSPAHLAVLRDLEGRFAPIEAGGSAKVGIGVATGNDNVYIVGEDADIEADRLVPLVMRDDIDRGRIRDGRRFVINTFGARGKVVDLKDYPRLRRYLQAQSADVKQRHVAQKNPTAWFRTIDRVYPELVSRPKLLIPDIAGSNEVVFDKGRFHPHHNLYFVTSDIWDLEVLGGLLSSKVALFFVWSYAVKMRGGYLRFQAQYLRRIRLPRPVTIAPALAREIRTAFRRRDFEQLDSLALRAYALESLPAFDFVDTRK